MRLGRWLQPRTGEDDPTREDAAITSELEALENIEIAPDEAGDASIRVAISSFADLEPARVRQDKHVITIAMS